ncbi:MAG: site-specific integrase, partial [Crocinitomicaceae bacterium]|nr:site-specific integrase [Crocinitomicaceae bacterium]
MRNNQKFSVTIWPNKQKEKNGLIPLYIKVSVDGKKAVMSTTHFIELSHWDKKQSKLKFNAPDSRQLNAFIDRTRNIIQQQFL